MEMAENKKCLLSIIVPVYNIQDYIGTCLESLCMQGFQEDEYEVLCINDGSTDSSETVVQQMIEKYPQIRLIKQENQGVSVARNTGIDASRGQYLFFCDGDDFLEPYCLKRAAKLCLEQKAVSASFGFQTVDEKAEMREVPLECNEEIKWASGRSKPFYSGNIWRFIVSREFLNKNNIRFKAGMRYAEDELFLYHICRFLNFKDHIYIDEIFYNYRMRASSAVHQKRDIRLRAHYKDMVEMAQEYKQYLQDETLSKEMQKSTLSRYRYAVSNAMQDALILGEQKPTEVLAELRKKGLYPFGFMIELLKPKRPKTMAVNYGKFFYSIPIYYSIAYKVNQLLKKRRAGG